MLIGLGQIWLYTGAGVAIVFLMFGIGRVDDEARGSYIFRPLLVPGVLLLWPLVVWRWVQAEMSGPHAFRRDRPLRDAHGYVWLVLAVLIPAILIGSLAIRQTLPEAGTTAVQMKLP